MDGIDPFVAFCYGFVAGVLVGAYFAYVVLI